VRGVIGAQDNSGAGCAARGSFAGLWRKLFRGLLRQSHEFDTPEFRCETAGNELIRVPASPSKSAHRARRVLRMLLTLLVIYLLAALVVTLLQRQMIYFPTRLTARVAGTMAAQAGMLPWRNGRGEPIGWRLPAAGTATGSVLIVHGNAGSALNRGYLAGPIHAAAPFDVFILEYPGFGTREGEPGMADFLAAADDAFEALPGNAPIFIVSESLGAGVAAHLAGKHPHGVAGLAMFAPYDRLVSVGQARMPVFPVALMMRDQFDPQAWLRDYRGPVKVVLAERDEVISPRFGRRLFESLAGPKHLEVIPRAYHNDIAGQSPEWWRGVVEFWGRNGQQSR
jgi:pimeloyl-ACP methyl ester carboxylesterase